MFVLMVNKEDPDQAGQAYIHFSRLKGLCCMTWFISGGKYTCCKDYPGAEMEVHLRLGDLTCLQTHVHEAKHFHASATNGF